MSKAHPISNSGLFFSALQRYISLSSRHPDQLHRQQCIKPTNLRTIYHHQTEFVARFQSTSTSTSTTPTIPASTPSPHQTHYTLFPQSLPQGPPPHGPFTVDAPSLRREYLRLQSQSHPDRHPPHLKSRAEGTSAHISNAYRTLLSPLLRAQYLLSLRGIDVAEDEGLKIEDPELLMEVLEAREAIEQAEGEEEVENMKIKNEGNIQKSEELLERAFREDDIQAAKAEAVRLRYWTNIKESLDAWEKGKPVVLVH